MNEAEGKTGVKEGSERRHVMESAKEVLLDLSLVNGSHSCRKVSLKLGESRDMYSIFRCDVIHDVHLGISVTLNEWLMRYL